MDVLVNGGSCCAISRCFKNDLLAKYKLDQTN